MTVESSATVGRTLSLVLLERDDHLAALRDLLAAVVTGRQGRCPRAGGGAYAGPPR